MRDNESLRALCNVLAAPAWNSAAAGALGGFAAQSAASDPFSAKIFRSINRLAKPHPSFAITPRQPQLTSDKQDGAHPA